MKKLFQAAAMAMALTPTAGFTQDFEKGFSAAKTGDFATALREWRPLAEQGHATAQYNLGWMYKNGKGVSQDDAEAVRWYRLAAEQGLASAQYNLGIIYKNGEGVLQDTLESVRWLSKAAKQGNVGAQLSLGNLYETNKAIETDIITAHMWYNIAISLGVQGFSMESIEDVMEPAEIIEAQRRARVCVESDYQVCD